MRTKPTFDPTKVSRGTGKTVGFLEAIAAMELGKVVQRVSPDGTSQKFTRIKDGRVQTAVNNSAYLNNKWERAQTDIDSFYNSKYRIVTKVTAKNPIVRTGTQKLTMEQAIVRMRANDIFQRIDPIFGKPVEFVRISPKGEMQTSMNAETLFKDEWEMASGAISAFFTSKFVHVDEISSDSAVIEYEQ